MNNYLLVLKYIHSRPQTFQSDHFRGNAGYYAEAASRGHITSLDNGMSTDKWSITANGLSFITMMDNHF